MNIPTRPANARDRGAPDDALTGVLLSAQDAAIAFGPIDMVRDAIGCARRMLRRRQPRRIAIAAGHWATPRPSPQPH
jgi:hypothetical protein